MDSERQSDPSQETPYFENQENLQANLPQKQDFQQSQPKEKFQEDLRQDENVQSDNNQVSNTKPQDQDKLTLAEEFDAIEQGFHYATDFLAGSFDTIVNLVRSNENDTKDQESKKSENKFESFKKELIEKTSPSPKQSHHEEHPHHQLHADSQSFRPTQESHKLVEKILESHEGEHQHHLTPDSQSFKPNPESKILTEKVIEGLEDQKTSLVEKVEEAEKQIEEGHAHQESHKTPSKEIEKRKSDEFWFAEDGPIRERFPQKQEKENVEEKQEERVPFLDHVIHGYQAVTSTLGYMKNLISPSKAKIKKEASESAQKNEKKEKRVVGADITNKASIHEEEHHEEKGARRKESWSQKLGRKLSETFDFAAQEDNPKIA